MLKSIDGNAMLFYSRGQVDFNNEGESLLGEAVPLKAQKHSLP